MSTEIYRVAERMLQDGRSTIELCSSIEDTEKVQGICDWLSEKKSRKASAKQYYVLQMFIANNLVLYGNVVDEKTVNDVFYNLVR